jgi:ribonuclease-3 family protein
MIDDSDCLHPPFICSVGESPIPIGQLSPTALAYIGDAVYELYIRTRYLLPPKKIADYHGQVVAQVRAEAQAACVRQLEPHLTEAERDLLRRGRNGVHYTPKRLSPKLYQEASSLETLMGYLYLTDPQRLSQLLEKLKLD